MPNNTKGKEDFRIKTGIDLTDEEFGRYNQGMTKLVKGPTIMILFETVLLLFIVIGLLTGNLPQGKETYLPLGIVVFFLISGASSLTKRIEKYQKEFAEGIKNLRGEINQINAQSIPYGNYGPNPSNQGPTQVIYKQPLEITTLDHPIDNKNNPFLKNEQQTTQLKRPIPAVQCPICNQTIPVNSNPCPKCGSPLLWE